MSSSTLCSLLVILCLILLFQSPLPTKASRSHVHHRLLGVGHYLIDQVCHEVIDYYSLCQKALREDSEIVHAKNFTELSVAILKLGLKKGEEGQIFLRELAKENHIPAIEDCATIYYDAVIRAFKASLSLMKSDLISANYEAKIAGDGTNYCDQALSAVHIHNPKIFYLNRQITMLGFSAYSAMVKIGEQ